MITVYDTTLRDGMQGEGMSLSADEKLRVAHALDSLGVHLIEAGLPRVQPQGGGAVRAARAARRFETAELAAFGMTRRRDAAAADDPALRLLADGFAPVCTLVGKTWSLHLEKVTQVEPEENLRMIADSVGFLVGQGKRVVYDAEHFFDGFRDDPGYALRCLRAAAEAGADNVTLCDTNGSSVPAQVSEATARGGRRARRDGPGRHPHPRRRRLRRGELAGGGRGRRPHGAGHAERLRRALRQRQPDHDPPDARAQDGLRRASAASGCGA